MNKVIFLFMRRMRMPLIILIIAYAVSILGMVLIPGVDSNGQPWSMDFFHAFYFVSYMATTIGFGELPHPFTEAQRMWTVVSVYLTVIAWLYGIGKILALVQDPKFKQAVEEQGFTRSIRSMEESFYIVCGYGDTGSMLVRALSQRNIHAVVVDISQERINELEMTNHGLYVPALCADASLSYSLREAGLTHKRCIGVVALTDDDDANLKIAITTKLLHPGIQVICRAETHDVEANMASFGTDLIINPFDTFARRLALALHSPGSHYLYDVLTSVPNSPMPKPLYPPHGSWVLCGYGRFGKAVYHNLKREGVETTIVEQEPEATGCVGMCIPGRGTEAETLRQAGVEEAVGIVAGTDSDANNLSMIMTAAELNPSLFMVARQNRHDNEDVFAAAAMDLVMQRSEIIARDILSMLMTPLLTSFLDEVRIRDNEWANEMSSRLFAVTGEVVPELESVRIDPHQAPAVVARLEQGGEVLLEHLLMDSRDRSRSLPCLPLMLRKRQGELVVSPGPEQILSRGDEILFCGRRRYMSRMAWTLNNANALSYIQTGREQALGYVWAWLSKRFSFLQQLH